MQKTKLSAAVASDFTIRQQKEIEKENISAIAKCLFDQDEQTLGKYVALLGEDKVEAIVDMICRDLEQQTEH